MPASSASRSLSARGVFDALAQLGGGRFCQLREPRDHRRPARRFPQDFENADVAVLVCDVDLGHDPLTEHAMRMLVGEVGMELTGQLMVSALEFSGSATGQFKAPARS